jgi:PAS domain S-box-containing protein
MKKNSIITDIETKMQDDEFIVSKTDLRGYITYTNKTFLNICGYDRSELAGVNHNIIRHPDMPKVAFRYMWSLVKDGKDFFGFVKNLRKDGGYYWVFAYISPDFDEADNIIGYTSIRRKPPQTAIDAITGLYKSLLEIEKDGKNENVDKAQKHLEEFLQTQNCSYEDLILKLQDD